MPEVQVYGDQNELVDTNRFPYAKFPFEKFNPVQSRFFELYEQDANCLVAAATSAGKTTIAEMSLSHETRVRGGKGMYLGPLKALTQEKIDDWTDKNHHFSDLKISICTGDYRLSKQRHKEISESHLIIMTNEMLTSRCRNYKAEHNDWLREIGTLIIDESHILTTGRGDHVEVGLMKFCEINKNCRLVMLSATMPNVKEISSWSAYYLNNKSTNLIKSDFRPCKLNIHYEKYWDGGKSYQENEYSKIDSAINIVMDYPEDKFLIFVHTKRTGEMLKRELKRNGIEAEFHNADLTKEKRIELQEEFKKRKEGLRVIIATNTLAWGVNLPARRTIITGVHRGLSEVANYDIKQQVGRCGRVGLDPQGDAYILLPEFHYDEWVGRLQKCEDIESQLLDKDIGGHHKTLAFHILSEIHHGGIKNKEDLYNWYERSLAHFQNKNLDDEVIENVIDLLLKCSAIREEDGIFKCNAVGIISSLFYFSPFDIADYRKNFKLLFDSGNDRNDLWLSVVLGNTDTNRAGIVSKVEREEMAGYARMVKKIFGDSLKEPVVKAGYVYFNLLNGRDSKSMNAIQRGFQQDFPRALEVIKAIDTMSTKWGELNYFKKLGMRINYGVDWPLTDLCLIPNIGGVRAKKLYQGGLKSLEQIVENPVLVKQIVGMKDDKIDQIISDARKILISGDNF